MTTNVLSMRQQQLHSYHLALVLILLFLTVCPYIFNNYNICCSVSAYSGDELYLKHDLIDKFDIITSYDIITSRKISIRSVTEQLLHKHSDGEQQETQNHSVKLNYDIVSHNVERNVSDAINRFPKWSGPIKKVHFSSLGRRFNLVLGKPNQLITDDLTIVTLDGYGKETRVPFNHNDLQVMEGYLDGEARSLAMVAFSHSSDKFMTAQIQSGQDTFIVEPAYLHKNELKYYDESSDDYDQDNSSILSRLHNDSMIVYNLHDHKQFSPGGAQGETNGNSSLFNPEQLCGAVKLNATKLDDEFNGQNSKLYIRSNTKDKRSIDLPLSQEVFKDKTRCTLHLVADYLFYKNIGNGDLQTTINYLLALIDRVNSIYLPTVWETGEDTLTNVGFTVQNITIHREYTRTESNDSHYNMKTEDPWVAREFLDNFSRNSPPSHYCLAHLLTYRKFDSPVLGLAYVASTRFGTIGGICSPTQQSDDKYFKHNTGISTSRGIHGETLITRQADLVLAHELGHNLGAEHDSDVCRPDPNHGGAFLMHPFAVMGFERNNRFLSNCSRLSIGRVIKRKRASCFIGVVDNVCGNGVREGDEECDGGDVGLGHSDPCCDSFCKFTPGSRCSDRHSWCCFRCRVVPAGRQCRPAEEYNCKQAVLCDGNDAECPVEAPPVEDNRTCVGRGLCRNGNCIPFCEARGLQSCLCNTPAEACKLCCKTSINSTCVPYDTKADYLPDGVLCYRGVCEKGRCEQPIQDVVQRLWDVIEDINFTTLGKFLRDNIILVVLVASIPIWCVVTHFINEFDKQIKQDVISTLAKNRRRKKSGEISRSPFLPRLFVGDEASTNSTDDPQNSRNETLQPLKPQGQVDLLSIINSNGQRRRSPNIGFQPSNIGFQLPGGEEVAIEPRGTIAMNSIELPHQGGFHNASRSLDGSNRGREDDEIIANAYSTQV